MENALYKVEKIHKNAPYSRRSHRICIHHTNNKRHTESRLDQRQRRQLRSAAAFATTFDFAYRHNRVSICLCELSRTQADPREQCVLCPVLRES